MTVSFYLTEKTFKKTKHHRNEIEKRLYRLIYPHIVWTGIYAILNIPLYLDRGKKSWLKDVILQLCFGHTMNKIMWFQIDLILITLILMIICHLGKNEKIVNFVFLLIGLSAIIAQYTTLNFVLFGRLPDAMRYTLGRVAEIFPYAILGIFLARVKVIELVQHKAVALLCSALALNLLFGHRNFFLEGNGFGYNGIYRMIASTFMVLIFLLLPNGETLKGLPKILGHISGCTMGVYYSHRIVGRWIMDLSGKWFRGVIG